MDQSDFLTDHDRLESLNHEKLLEVFRRNRKLMSSMEHPQTFLNQLRVHELIPKEMYQTLNGMKSKELRQKQMYQMLNWLEEKGSNCIQRFWRCVFRDHLLQQYPTLRQLHRSLLGDNEVKKIRKTAKGNESSEEEEQPSTSTQTAPSQKKKVQMPVFSCPLKKGETADIWTWPKYKTQLPITCGDKKATLYRDKMARGEDCIQAGDQWFTPAGFEEFGGTISRKNWKTSIRCECTTLEKLIQEGHLTSPSFRKRKVGQSQRDLVPTDQSAVSSTDSEHEANEELEQEREEGERGENSTPAGGGSSPGRSSPGRSSPGRSSAGRSTPGRSSPAWSSPGRSSPGRSSPGWSSPGRSSPAGSSPGRSSPGRSSPGRSSPGRSSPGRSSPGRSSPGRSSPGRSSPGRSTPGRSTPGRSSPGRSLVVPHKTVFQVTCGMLNKEHFTSAEEEEAEEEQETGTRKRKTSKGNESCEEEEKPRTSTQAMPIMMKNVPKPVFSSPVKKRILSDIWTWPEYKTQLPITCGDKKATLYRDKMARGEDCIQAGDQWFTPAGFEEFGGKKSSRKWKSSIRCNGTTLEKLFQGGHLTVPIFRRKLKPCLPFNPSRSSVWRNENKELDALSKKEVGNVFESGNDEEEEAEQENEEEERGEQSTPARRGHSPGRSSPGRSSPGWSPVVPQETVFQVTCGVTSGMLHKQRFASGTRGKCIRTEQSWKTPIEFLSEGSNMTEASWKKDILWDGKPLSTLIENKLLEIHTLLCKCLSCNPTAEDLQDQENDDDCFTCRSEGSLICCEECPRSFHPGCHLPNVDGAMLGNDLPWFCTFCILSHSQSWRFPSKNTYQEVLNYQTSKHRLECQYLLLYLYHEDMDHIIVKDPRTNVRKYSSVIKTPKWLDEVARKLQDGQYQTVKLFVSDLLLIFTNCVTFNRDNAKTAKRLKDVFERELKQVFSF